MVKGLISIIRFRLIGFIFTSGLLLQVAVCFALDNPDAGDYISVFQERSEEFERIIYKLAKNQEDIISTYIRYSEFLDQELNRSYIALNNLLDENSRHALQKSQRLWIQFRDAEYDFIDKNWIPANFGSSSSVSRSAYRNSILKNRVLELLYYLQNYKKNNQ